MVPRRPTELAFEVDALTTLLIHPKDLDQIDTQLAQLGEQDRLADAHIYLLVKRPRISFVPGSVQLAEGSASGRFRYRVEGEFIEHPFRLTTAASRVADNVTTSSFPHALLQFWRSGQQINEIPSYIASFRFADTGPTPIRELEVIYVGMSFADSDHSIVDRLSSHSTMQKALADASSNDPDSEILIVLIALDDPKIPILLAPVAPRPGIDENAEVAIALRRAHQELTPEIQVTLAEAAFIRYFQPLYNDRYKRTFPSPDHKILTTLYSIDFATLSVTLDAESIGVRLFSKTRLPGQVHIAAVDLHDPAERNSFFNTLNEPDGPTAQRFSGPVF